jgi:hypothetical protein
MNCKGIQKGSGLFFKSKSSNSESFVKLLKKAVTSEKNVIDEYKKYITIYKNHIENLDGLDNYIESDNYKFDSFRKSFELIKTKVFDKDFNEQPLLLKNYKDISDDSFTDDIIEYHILQQIKYLLLNTYSKKDNDLIRLVSLRNIKTKPEFQIFSIDDKMTEYLPLFHNQYQLDYEKMKEVFDQVIEYIKATVKKPFITEIDNDNSKPKKNKEVKTPDMNPFNNKDMDKSDKKTKKVNKKTTIKPKTMKTKTMKTKKAKSKTVNQKNLEDITLPMKNESLPVVKIQLPKKLL